MVENITNSNKKLSVKKRFLRIDWSKRKPYDLCWSGDFDSFCGDIGEACPLTGRDCELTRRGRK